MTSPNSPKQVRPDQGRRCLFREPQHGGTERDVPRLLTVVDGTLLSALPTMMEVSLRKGKTGTAMVTWRR